MVALIILGAIALVITLIMLVPVGADVGYESGELRLSAKVCGMLLQLLPKTRASRRKRRSQKKRKNQRQKNRRGRPPRKRSSALTGMSFWDFSVPF